MKMRFGNYKFAHSLYELLAKIPCRWSYRSFDMLHGKSQFYKGEDTYYLVEVRK